MRKPVPSRESTVRRGQPVSRLGRLVRTVDKTGTEREEGENAPTSSCPSSPPCPSQWPCSASRSASPSYVSRNPSRTPCTARQTHNQPCAWPASREYREFESSLSLLEIKDDLFDALLLCRTTVLVQWGRLEFARALAVLVLPAFVGVRRHGCRVERGGGELDGYWTGEGESGIGRERGNGRVEWWVVERSKRSAT